METIKNGLLTVTNLNGYYVFFYWNRLMSSHCIIKTKLLNVLQAAHELNVAQCYICITM